MALKILIFLALGFLAYVKALHAPFCFDDQTVIVSNPLLQHLLLGWQGIVQVWHFQPSRILTNLSIAFNYQIGQLHVFGYHLTSLLIHFAAAAGVWVFVRLMITIREGVKPGVDLGFWAALLFLVHPVNTEAVSYVSQRSSALVAAFYVWSLVFYVRFRQELQWKNIVAAAGLALGALLSKETAVTLPLAWMLADYFVTRKKSPAFIWAVLALMAAAVAMFFGFALKPLFLNPIYSQSHRGDVLTWWTYLLTQARVLVVFLRLIVVPVGLNIDYDFPMSHGLLEWPTAAGIGLLALLFWAAFIFRKSKHWPLAFAYFALLVTVLPHLLPPRGNVIAEHKLYLSLTMVVPFICYWLYTLIPVHLWRPVMGLLIGIFFILTWQRNALWADPVRLWEQTVIQSPQKARCYLNLGVAYYNAGRLSEALSSYQKTIAMAPEIFEAYTDAAVVFAGRQDWGRVITYDSHALQVNPSDDVAYVQQAVGWAHLGQNQQAVDDLTHALSLNPHWYEIYKMRGFLYEQLSKYPQALNDYRAWLHINPQDWPVIKRYNRLIDLNSSQGYDKSLKQRRL